MKDLMIKRLNIIEATFVHGAGGQTVKIKKAMINREMNYIELEFNKQLKGLDEIRIDKGDKLLIYYGVAKAKPIIP